MNTNIFHSMPWYFTVYPVEVICFVTYTPLVYSHANKTKYHNLSRKNTIKDRSRGYFTNGNRQQSTHKQTGKFPIFSRLYHGTVSRFSFRLSKEYIHIQTHTHIYICMYVSMYVCTYIYIYMDIFFRQRPPVPPPPPIHQHFSAGMCTHCSLNLNSRSALIIYSSRLRLYLYLHENNYATIFSKLSPTPNEQDVLSYCGRHLWHHLRALSFLAGNYSWPAPYN